MAAPVSFSVRYAAAKRDANSLPRSASLPNDLSGSPPPLCWSKPKPFGELRAVSIVIGDAGEDSRDACRALFLFQQLKACLGGDPVSFEPLQQRTEEFNVLPAVGIGLYQPDHPGEGILNDDCLNPIPTLCRSLADAAESVDDFLTLVQPSQAVSIANGQWADKHGLSFHVY